MISLETIKKIVYSYNKSHFPDAIIALNIGNQSLPGYTVNGQSIPVCATATKQGSLTATCRSHYQSLNAQEGVTSCPFGLKQIYFSRTIITKVIRLIGIINFDKTSVTTNMNDYSRKPKKALKQNLERTNNVDLKSEETSIAFKENISIITTLLDGRVAEAIRGYSHAMLTPIQGAMNDADELFNSQKQNETTQRFKNNLSTVKEYAGNIKLLLADHSEFAFNKLRSTPAHNLISTILGRLEKIAHEKHVRIFQGFNKGPINIRIIPNQFSIAMTNVIENAVKYSHHGNQSKFLEVAITYEHIDQFLLIKVCNLGCGITKDEIEERKLFDLGYRGILSVDRNREGTGSGLFLADKVVFAHGGKIDVTSEPVGNPTEPQFQKYKTTFSLFWPIDPETTKTAKR